MSAKKKYEYREKKNFNRESEGLKQRRLKDESRWKFNPNQEYASDDVLEEEDWFSDPEFDDRR
jgi:hypothetical protein